MPAISVATEPGAPFAAPASSGIGGAGIPTKLAPPSVVRTTEVHSGLLQGASPRSQKSSGETAVNETGSKPVGTGPPAGCPLASVPGTAVRLVLGAGGLVVATTEVEVPPETTPVEAAVLAEVAVPAEERCVPLVVVGRVTVVAGVAVVATAGDVVTAVVALLLPLAGWRAEALVPPQAAKTTVSAATAPARAGALVLMTLLTLGRPSRFLLVGPARCPARARRSGLDPGVACEAPTLRG
jgi:hypothetical protein